jgi:hypothetical protein
MNKIATLPARQRRREGWLAPLTPRPLASVCSSRWSSFNSRDLSQTRAIAQFCSQAASQGYRLEGHSALSCQWPGVPAHRDGVLGQAQLPQESWHRGSASSEPGGPPNRKSGQWPGVPMAPRRRPVTAQPPQSAGQTRGSAHELKGHSTGSRQWSRRTHPCDGVLGQHSRPGSADTGARELAATLTGHVSGSSPRRRTPTGSDDSTAALWSAGHGVAP